MGVSPVKGFLGKENPTRKQVGPGSPQEIADLERTPPDRLLPYCGKYPPHKSPVS